MPDSGNYVALDLASVKTSEEKTVEFVTKAISGRKSNQRFVVIFLGETHNNTVDTGVTSKLLQKPPLTHPGHTRLILERGLQYVSGVGIDSEKTEPTDPGASRSKRSKVIANMIIDAFSEDNRFTLIYIACGSAHCEEIYVALNKRMKNRFTFIAKPSCTD
jgi:hypothetical protein